MGAGRVSIGSTAGSHIGCGRVVEQVGSGGENGRIVYEYTSPFEHPDALNTQNSLKDPTSDSFKTGLLKRQRTYSREGALVMDRQNTYKFIQTDFKSLKVSLGRIAPPAYSGTSLYQMMILGSAHANYSFEDRFAFSCSPYRLGFARLKKSVDMLDGVTKETLIAYDPSKRHNQPVAVSFTNSDGKLHRTETDYAHEAAASCLLTENMVGLPVAFRSYVGGEFVGGSRIAYGSDGSGGCMPLQYYQTLANGSEVLRAEVLEYHANGFPAACAGPVFPRSG